MAISFFDEKAFVPTDEMVADVLGDCLPLWVALQNHVRENYPNVVGEWKHYGKNSGWVFKLLSKKRNLLFFIPKDGCFRLRFGFGEKAAACVEISDLPSEIKEAVRIATAYVEGRSIDLDINPGQANIMAYVQDRRLVDVGKIVLDSAETLIQVLHISKPI
jgi:hypothetical protein